MKQLNTISAIILALFLSINLTFAVTATIPKSPIADGCATIVLKTGDIISANVIQISPTEVKYKRCGKPNDPEMILLLSQVLKIKDADGSDMWPVSTTIAAPTPALAASTPTPESTSDGRAMCDKGAMDSRAFYHGENCGAGGVAATTILTSPLIGLIPYGICISTPPANENLNYPDSKLFQNADYQRCYVDAAKVTKTKKHNRAMLTSSGIWLGLILILTVL